MWALVCEWCFALRVVICELCFCSAGGALRVVLCRLCFAGWGVRMVLCGPCFADFALREVLCRVCFAGGALRVVLVGLCFAKMDDGTAILARFVNLQNCVCCACRLVPCKNERQYCDFGKMCDL